MRKNQRGGTKDQMGRERKLTDGKTEKWEQEGSIKRKKDG